MYHFRLKVIVQQSTIETSRGTGGVLGSHRVYHTHTAQDEQNVYMEQKGDRTT